MALNGRQKAKTAALMGAPRRGMFDGPSPDQIAGAMEPVEFLRMLVKLIEEGSIEARTIRVESFRNPQTFRTVNGDFQSFLPGDMSMSLQMELVPTGNGPSERGNSYMGTGTINIDDEDDGIGIDSLESPSPSLDRALDKAEAKERKRKFDEQAARTATPAGASAAREIIFDDDASDPT